MGSNNRSLSESHVLEFVEAFGKFDEGQTGKYSEELSVSTNEKNNQ